MTNKSLMTPDDIAFMQAKDPFATTSPASSLGQWMRAFDAAGIDLEQPAARGPAQAPPAPPAVASPEPVIGCNCAPCRMSRGGDLVPSEAVAPKTRTPPPTSFDVEANEAEVSAWNEAFEVDWARRHPPVAPEQPVQMAVDLVEVAPPVLYEIPRVEVSAEDKAAARRAIKSRKQFEFITAPAPTAAAIVARAGRIDQPPGLVKVAMAPPVPAAVAPVDLDAVAGAVASPGIEPAAVGQHHLGAVGLTSGPLAIETPALGVAVALTAVGIDIELVEITAPMLGQVEHLDAGGLTVDAPDPSTPSIEALVLDACDVLIDAQTRIAALEGQVQELMLAIAGAGVTPVTPAVTGRSAAERQRDSRAAKKLGISIAEYRQKR